MGLDAVLQGCFASYRCGGIIRDLMIQSSLDAPKTTNRQMLREGQALYYLSSKTTIKLAKYQFSGFPLYFSDQEIRQLLPGQIFFPSVCIYDEQKACLGVIEHYRKGVQGKKSGDTLLLQKEKTFLGSSASLGGRLFFSLLMAFSGITDYPFDFSELKAVGGGIQL